MSAGTPGLDLYFLGNAGAPPQLNGIGYAAAPSPFVIYIAGDSTVCDQTDPEYGGWGQQLPPYFNYPVSVANYADSGESSGSFLGSGSLFGAINSRLKANDWVLVQFGHNDKDVTAATFHDNMTSYVTRVKAKNAFPVLITPVARATFSGNTVTAQHINNTGADLPAIIKQVGDGAERPRAGHDRAHRAVADAARPARLAAVPRARHRRDAHQPRRRRRRSRLRRRADEASQPDRPGQPHALTIL